MRKLILCPMCYGLGKIADKGLSQCKVCHICIGSGRAWQITTFEPYDPEKEEDAEIDG
jgi:hypothetical protein